MLRSWILLSLLALGSQGHAQDKSSDFCDADGGTWSCLLNEWAVTASANNDTHCRRGRVMSLPPTKGYYVTDRMDPPPPPHHMHHGNHIHPHGPPKPAYYEEWQASPPPPGAGKIVNRPPNPYKDQFRPSYPAPSPNQPIPLPLQQPPRPAADRVDEAPPPPPPKRVTETDLYLLTAIEKLVFRADLMEKRLRKLEESVHHLVAGREPQPEPCPEEFTRVGSACYHFSSESLDWKSANLRCRRLRANLLEFRSNEQRRQVHSALLADKRRRGDDWWTGGLNPGLLWIWSHSARPVLNDTSANSTQSATSIAGEGRCLALVHNPAVSAYVYRGQDCAVRIRYVCEREEDAARLSNEIEKTAKQLEDTSNVLKKVHTAKLAENVEKTEKMEKAEKPAEKTDKLNLQAL